MSVTVRIDTKKLDEIAANLGRRRSDILGSVAAQVLAHAITLAPVDTGALKNSLHMEKQDQALGTDTWFVLDGVEYGIYQEFGPMNNKRVWKFKPFMVPATEAAGRDFDKMWERLFT